jgi:hypothetical protein
MMHCTRVQAIKEDRDTRTKIYGYIENTTIEPEPNTSTVWMVIAMVQCNLLQPRLATHNRREEKESKLQGASSPSAQRVCVYVWCIGGGKEGLTRRMAAVSEGAD